VIDSTDRGGSLALSGGFGASAIDVYDCLLGLANDPSGAAVGLTAGQLRLFAAANTVQSLSGDATSTVSYAGSAPGTLTVANSTDPSQAADFAGVIQDTLAGALSVFIAGAQQFTGANTYTSGTEIDNSAELDVNSSLALGASSGTVTLNGGTLGTLSDGSVYQPVVVSAGTIDYLDTYGKTVFIAAPVTGNGTLDVIGGGMALFANAGGVGMLESTDGTSYDTSPTVIMSSADIGSGAWNGQDVVITNNASVTLGGDPTPNLIFIDAGSTLAINLPGPGPYNLSCAVAGDGTLLKNDGYALTLSGDNSQFAGAYDVENGNVTFACPTSGLANLVDNGLVGFTNAQSAYGFGDFSDNGSGTSTLDLTNAGTVIFAPSSADVFSGTVLGSCNSFVIAASAGSLTFNGTVGIVGNMTVNGTLINNGNLADVSDAAAGCNTLTVNGTLINNGYVADLLEHDGGTSVMYTNGLLVVNGTLTNNNYLRFATITVTGLLDNYGLAAVSATTTDDYGAVYYYENGVLNVQGTGQVINEAGGSEQALSFATGLFVLGGVVYYDGWAVTQDDSGMLNLYDSATFTNYGAAVIGGTRNVIGEYAAYNDYGTTELWPN
jgi:hypothetical protein